jgi:energy-coupling factor transport system substrate-specific component
MVSTTRVPAHGRVRQVFVYLLMVVVGAGAFLYPFWVPGETFQDRAHAGDAPLIAAAIGALVVGAVALEVRRGTMNGATVAMLGVLASTAGLLRLIRLAGGGNFIFFLVILAGAAFGARFGLLLGLCSMAVSAVITGGVGPWLPFQMLALGWMGGGAGFLGRVTARLAPRLEVLALAVYGWGWAFVFGAIMNLWFWPFLRGGALSWHPGLGVGETLHRYWSFYASTSFAWDAAGGLTNAALILVTGTTLMRTLRRFAHRLEPTVELADINTCGLPTSRSPR